MPALRPRIVARAPAADPWLEVIRHLPSIEEVELLAGSGAARVRLHAITGAVDYIVNLAPRAALTDADVRTLGRREESPARRLLLAGAISSRQGAELRQAGVDYVDLAGNCHLHPSNGLYVHIEGQKLTHVGGLPRSRQREAAYQVMRHSGGWKRTES